MILFLLWNVPKRMVNICFFQLPRIEEQRASTPTIDERREPMERRDPMSSQVIFFIKFMIYLLSTRFLIIK